MLGKAIESSALVIVLGRSGIAAVILGAGLLIAGRSLAPPAADRSGLIASGILLALHWLAFFQSISMSSVAIGVVGFATFPLFVTALGPVLGGQRLRWLDGLTALAVLVGLALVASPGQASGQLPALGLAVFSGFLFALLTLLNRHLVQRHSFLLVAYFQQAGAALCLLPAATVLGSMPSGRDWLLIGVLGIVCSALAQTLFIKSLDQVRAQLASVVTGLEPVYAIALAALLIREVPPPTTLVGAGIVLLAVTIASYFSPSPTD